MPSNIQPEASKAQASDTEMRGATKQKWDRFNAREIAALEDKGDLVAQLQTMRHHKELHEEVIRVLHDGNEGAVEPVELYRSLRLIEDRCRTFGFLVPEVLQRLERDLEEEFCTVSQGR